MMRTMEDHVFYRNLRSFYPTVDRGEGIYIYDTKGKEYIDGSVGAAVVSIGHGVREITEAMLRQAEKISFAHGSHFTSDAADRSRFKISRLSPRGLSKVYFPLGGLRGSGNRCQNGKTISSRKGKTRKV
jgi:adenosylmethionine-8-amino-7-oxononanoate aminotransferase